MKKILGIGNALVDVMKMLTDDTILATFKLPKGSMQLVDASASELIKRETADLDTRFSSGGSAANTIYGLGMLGVETGFIGSIGKDRTGDFFENDMKSAGVSCHLFKRETATGTAVTLISPDSERTFATHLGAAVELNQEDLLEDYFRPCHILYLEGYLILNKFLVEKACRIAKENNMKIAIDLASYNVVGANRTDFIGLTEKYADIIFANEDEAKAFTGKDAAEALAEISRSSEIAVVKAGADGSWIRRGEEIIKVDALPVHVKDTTGAGDLYASGFLYGYSLGLNLEVCGQLGSILAGHVIQSVGAKMDEDTWKKIRKSVDELVSR